MPFVRLRSSRYAGALSGMRGDFGARLEDINQCIEPQINADERGLKNASLEIDRSLLFRVKPLKDPFNLRSSAFICGFNPGFSPGFARVMKSTGRKRPG